MLTLAACERPTEVIPSERAVPTEIARTLTGAVGTPIFPTAPPGDRQAIGDARGLNSAGQVTGAERGLTLADDFKAYRFTPDGGLVVIVGPYVSPHYGSDINDAGVIVGTTLTDMSHGFRGFVATSASMTILDILPGVTPDADGQAVAVNDAGTVAGWSRATDGTRHAVLWSSAGVIQDLGIPNSEAVDINASGVVLGSGPLGAAPFFRWTAGSVLDLAFTSVAEVNDAGQIIGTAASGGQSHAFLYTPGSGMRDLGTLGGATSAPTGLNNEGQVVGTSLTAGGIEHAFLWTPTDGMEDVTAVTGITSVRRLNDNLQTLGAPVVAPTTSPSFSSSGNPRLVQLNFTPTTPDSPPVAAFTWSCERNKCTFDASSSTDDNGIVSYVWDFDRDHGAGGRRTGVQTKTTYPRGGTHDVTLTVTDAKGQQNSVTHTVSVP